MAVEKRRDLVLIEGLDLESAPVHPAPQAGQAPEIGRSGLTCIVAPTKVACEGVNAGCQRAATQLAHRSAGKSPCRAHRGLLKWLTPLSKRENYVKFARPSFQEKPANTVACEGGGATLYIVGNFT
jgi:hypothetical protein